MSGPPITNLATINGDSITLRCDVAIIGAGAAGIYLGRRLAIAGKNVILIEAGGDVCASNAEMGFNAGFAQSPYPGATRGRFFGLGGSTSRWGGLLFPHTTLDAHEHTDFPPDQWPRIIDDVDRWGPIVLKRLNYPLNGDFMKFAETALHPVSSSLLSSGLVPAASLFIPFRNRNFNTMLDGSTAKDMALRILKNAVANRWTMDESDSNSTRLAKVHAISSNGKTATVTADKFIIAAGAIESTRILLELNECFPLPVTRTSSAVGAYMSDHLSHSVADIRENDRNRTIRAFAPKFSKGWMRSMRFIESKPPPGSPRAFGHIIFEHASSGFNVVREVLTGLQSRRLPKLSIGDYFSGITGASALAWGRYVRSELHIAKGTPSHLQLDIEQLPIKDNRIELGTELDRYGRRNPIIHWQASEQDLANLQTTGQRMVETWNQASVDLPRLDPQNLDWDSSRPHDTFHPVGTCRMGDDDEAVVTPDLKVWGTDNLWVTSTAVLPTAGTANPTYTLLCMAEGLATRLLEK